MNMVKIVFLISFALSAVGAEVSTVEIKADPPVSIQNETYSPSTNTSSTTTNAKGYYQSLYNSNWEMRAHRKLGAGFGVMGLFGQIGGVADINFDEQNAAQIGFGNGYGFNTFFAGWKISFESNYVSPYITIGYSRWYNSVSKDLRGNSYILDQVLTKSELQNGKIGVDFLLSNVGIQYNQLDSEWIGNSLFAEFNFLFSTARGTLVPAASIGTIYYF